jgi:hypothetical protein
MNHPLLYQNNTRVFLHERGAALGRHATLDDLSDESLDEVAARGFQWIWFLGVWQMSEVGRRISREDPVLRASYAEQLPDFTDDDIVGSPFAVQRYTVNRDFGGDMALARLRSRMADRDLRLLLDFVVNHTTPDHPYLFHPTGLDRFAETYETIHPNGVGLYPMKQLPLCELWFKAQFLTKGKKPEEIVVFPMTFGRHRCTVAALPEAIEAARELLRPFGQAGD